MNSTSWVFCFITSMLFRLDGRHWLNTDRTAVMCVIVSGFYTMFHTKRYETLFFFTSSAALYYLAQVYDSDMLHGMMHICSIIGQHVMVMPRSKHVDD